MKAATVGLLTAILLVLVVLCLQLATVQANQETQQQTLEELSTTMLDVWTNTMVLMSRPTLPNEMRAFPGPQGPGTATVTHNEGGRKSSAVKGMGIEEGSHRAEKVKRRVMGARLVRFMCSPGVGSKSSEVDRTPEAGRPPIYASVGGHGNPHLVHMSHTVIRGYRLSGAGCAISASVGSRFDSGTLALKVSRPWGLISLKLRGFVTQ